jgi:hypothetical protein
LKESLAAEEQSVIQKLAQNGPAVFMDSGTLEINKCVEILKNIMLITSEN